MAKCDNKLPSFRVRMHLPASSFRRHRDHTFEVKGETEFDVWGRLMLETLRQMGYGNDPNFQLGFWFDTLNTTPPEMRQALAHGIIRGLGMVVEDNEEGNGINFKFTTKYDPLVGDKETESGLVIPQAGGVRNPDIVLPGQE